MVIKQIGKGLVVILFVLFGLLQSSNHLVQSQPWLALPSILVWGVVIFLILQTLKSNIRLDLLHWAYPTLLAVVAYIIFWVSQITQSHLSSTWIILTIVNLFALILLSILVYLMQHVVFTSLRFKIGTPIATLVMTIMMTLFWYLQPWVTYGRFEANGFLTVLIFSGLIQLIQASSHEAKRAFQIWLLILVLLAMFYPTNFSNSIVIGFQPMVLISGDEIIYLLLFTVLITGLTLWQSHRAIDWVQQLRTHPIAHRGFYDETHPENTLSAYQRAIDRQFIIECDVRLTKDGQLVMFHDDTLKRQFNDERAIEEVTLAELREIHFSSGETIPTLLQMLHRVAGRVPILLELKPMGRRRKELVNKVIETLDSYSGHVALQSFDPLTMLWVAECAPSYPRGQLYYSYDNAQLDETLRYALSHLWLLMLYVPDFINGAKRYHLPLARILRSFMPSIGYTVQNELEDNEELKWYDNLIFEHFIPERYHR